MLMTGLERCNWKHLNDHQRLVLLLLLTFIISSFFFFYVSFVPLRFLLFGQPISGDRCKHVTFLLIFAVNFARFRWLSFVSHRVINVNASDSLINPFVMARLIKFSFFGFDGRLILFCLFVL